MRAKEGCRDGLPRNVHLVVVVPLMHVLFNDDNNLKLFVMKIGCLGLPHQIDDVHCASTRPPAADGQCPLCVGHAYPRLDSMCLPLPGV